AVALQQPVHHLAHQYRIEVPALRQGVQSRGEPGRRGEGNGHGTDLQPNVTGPSLSGWDVKDRQKRRTRTPYRPNIPPTTRIARKFSFFVYARAIYSSSWWKGVDQAHAWPARALRRVISDQVVLKTNQEG